MIRTIGLWMFLWMAMHGASNVLHQIAPLQAVMSGQYDGVISYRDIKKMGDFGIGTFDRVNGEMVALDGVFYQLHSDGRVSVVDTDQTTPFASVHFFSSDASHNIQQLPTLTALSDRVTSLLPNKQYIYGVKITGTFHSIRVRSPHAQNKPYEPLPAVLKQQAVFDHQGISGTMVGYYAPSFLNGVLVDGCHFHFISDDRQVGGHVLDANLANGTVYVDQISSMQLHLFGK